MGLPDPRLRPDGGSLAFGSEWYGQTWLASSCLLDAAAFAILLGDRRLSRTRRIAAWWWVGFLALLGPIALGRIDAVTVPLAITGLLWAAGRPRVAAILLTIGAWVKVWPAALLAAARDRLAQARDVVTVAVALSVGILGVSLLAGAGLNALGFVAEQAGRGLQVEAPIAAAWLWQIVAGSRRDIVYDREILTFQITGRGRISRPHSRRRSWPSAWRSSCSSASGPCGGAAFGRLLPPLALSFVVVLMLANKVGLAAVRDVARGADHPRPRPAAAPVLVPAVLAAAIALLTHVIYPYLYGWLLVAHPAFVLLVTVKAGAAGRAARVGDPRGVAGWDPDADSAESPERRREIDLEGWRNMLVAFSVAPSGTGRADGSVHDAVAAAVRIVRESGLPNRTDSMFTRSRASGTRSSTSCAARPRPSASTARASRSC